MPKDKYGNMPNNSSGNRSSRMSDTDSGAGGSNHGATGGLKRSSEMRPDTMKTPTTKNMYPKGLA